MMQFNRAIQNSRRHLKTHSSICLSCLFPLSCTKGIKANDYDLVIRGGRVIDPETGRDEIADAGTDKGRMAQISKAPLKGVRILNTWYLVVAPGFIDLHARGRDLASQQFHLLDVAASACELELGVRPANPRILRFESRKKKLPSWKKWRAQKKFCADDVEASSTRVAVSADIFSTGRMAPAAPLRRAALDRKPAFLREAPELSGASFCPHARTARSPDLASEQLERGVWGLTAADDASAETGPVRSCFREED